MGGAFGNEDAHYFLDLDMAVLGSPPDSYAEYRERIRGEYSFLSEPMYTALRLKVNHSTESVNSGMTVSNKLESDITKKYESCSEITIGSLTARKKGQRCFPNYLF